MPTVARHASRVIIPNAQGDTKPTLTESTRLRFLMSVAKSRADGRRPQEAAELLLGPGRVDLSNPARLTPLDREAAELAAEYFDRAGLSDRADAVRAALEGRPPPLTVASRDLDHRAALEADAHSAPAATDAARSGSSRDEPTDANDRAAVGRGGAKVPALGDTLPDGFELELDPYPADASDAIFASTPRDEAFAPTPRDAVRPTQTPPGPPFEIGALIADRYHIEARIGRGGIATVFRARDLDLGETVAIKVYGGAITDDIQLARFRQELRIARQILHRNVIRVYDIGVAYGRRYISMEHLTGGTINGLMRLSRANQVVDPLPIHDAIEYLIQACNGLEAAHALDVIHRDVKPDNLFVTADGVVKVVDFGTAKHLEITGITPDGLVSGTPEYMAPEQFRQFSEVTPAADIYALGICAYQMVSGRLPFCDDSLMQLLFKHLQSAPVPPRTHNPAVSEALEAAILRAIAKRPEARFENCAAFARALDLARGAR